MSAVGISGLQAGEDVKHMPQRRLQRVVGSTNSFEGCRRIPASPSFILSGVAGVTSEFNLPSPSLPHRRGAWPLSPMVFRIRPEKKSAGCASFEASAIDRKKSG